MTSYNLSIHRACSSYAGLDTFSSHFVKLKDEDEFNQVQAMCENGTNMAGILKWSFMPIRTASSKSVARAFLTFSVTFGSVLFGGIPSSAQPECSCCPTIPMKER